KSISSFTNSTISPRKKSKSWREDEMALFKNKYRIKSTRLKGWDYSSPGAYFVTIVTKNRAYYFGNVENGDMHLNELGEIAQQCFEKIPEHFLFVSLDSFVIMPNHVHGIIIIKPGNGGEIHSSTKTEIINDGGAGDVETLHATSLQQQPQQPETDAASYITAPKNKKMASISPKPSSLSVIIRSYKSAVSKQARQIHPDFVWQSRYYDHIIRDKKSLNNIRQYIIQNPLNWQADAENPVRNTNESVENAD
ncbi:MAG: hypothetical protein KAU83_02190, partial [Bacteroidales bacterium]|nr:hypothetical protein [Bacteroidales bacterium]